MSQNRYAGRHRPPAQPSHGRRLLVPLALVSTTVAGGVVVRSAGASDLSPEAAAVQDLSNTVAGGYEARDRAVAAAGSDRDAARASRDASRAAVASVVNLTDQKASDVDTAVEAARKAEESKKAEAAKKAAAARQAAEDARQQAQRWVSPLSNYTLTSGFGWRWGRMHPAQDLAAPVGTPVHALSTGTVIFSGWSSQGYGYMVQIRYWDGTVSWFAHNSRLLVNIGDEVAPGQVVSYSGNTGNSTGPHLHLEIHPQGAGSVPPRAWLAQKGVQL
ncbi:MAG: M23 family metallopeptidase [Intrasporangium sp.]|uniref:M23 family metallopeptidase n=1 Tax=Intrasporangium sp. TaxID=1925024 RepID=UPI003F7FC99E